MLRSIDFLWFTSIDEVVKLHLILFLSVYKYMYICVYMNSWSNREIKIKFLIITYNNLMIYYYSIILNKLSSSLL